jgi:hypothetical protein
MHARLAEQVALKGSARTPTLQRTIAPARSAPQTAAGRLLELQRTVGNAAVRRVIQYKLTVSQPGDPYEQEADRVADAAINAPDQSGSAATVDREKDADLTISRVCDACADEMNRAVMPEDEKDKELAGLQRQPEEEEDKNVPPVARSAAGDVQEVGGDVESGIRALPGAGRPLPTDVRSDMESRMGFDFGGVRIHTDSGAGQLAREVSAHAFTVGNDVVFANNQYRPETTDGRKLLAHELTHVVQQTGAPEQRRDGANGA